MIGEEKRNLGANLKHVVRKQKVVAKSSAEAELYAAGLVASEALGAQTLLSDLGVRTSIILNIDAQATMHLLHRDGLGRAKHVEVGYLWIQQVVRDGRITLRKVASSNNLADVGTKPLGRDVIMKLCGMMGFTAIDA